MAESRNNGNFFRLYFFCLDCAANLTEGPDGQHDPSVPPEPALGGEGQAGRPHGQREQPRHQPLRTVPRLRSLGRQGERREWPGQQSILQTYEGFAHRLNMEVDLQSLFGLQVT
jgi:hypothetical protein